MRLNLFLLCICLAFGMACNQTDDEPVVDEPIVDEPINEEPVVDEPIDTAYAIVSDHELVNDTFVHANAYTFQLEGNASGIVNKEGTWEIQLQKKDSSFFSVLTMQQESELFIESNSLIDLITETERFLYEGVQLVGRILFTSNDRSFYVDRRILILGKPAKPILRILRAEDNGYPDEKDSFFENIILEYICDGATTGTIIQREYSFDQESGSISYSMDLKKSSFIAEISKYLTTSFQLEVQNQIGTSYSEVLFIDAKAYPDSDESAHALLSFGLLRN